MEKKKVMSKALKPFPICELFKWFREFWVVTWSSMWNNTDKWFESRPRVRVWHSGAPQYPAQRHFPQGNNVLITVALRFRNHCQIIAEGFHLWGLKLHYSKTDVMDPALSRQSAHRWRSGCQPYASAALYPNEGTWYSFLLGVDSASNIIFWYNVR
jgi:hypothetical protein